MALATLDNIWCSLESIFESLQLKIVSGLVSGKYKKNGEIPTDTQLIL